MTKYEFATKLFYELEEKHDVQSIVKNENFKLKYDTQSTPYKATVKVYNEWFDLEK